MALLEITGNVRNRFVQAAVLLHLLNPVRGEPTGHGLDQDPYEVDTPRERLLKRKFLDSFALVCATRRNGDRVSAACIEEGSPQGTIIRIASNSGVQENTLSQVREIVEALNCIASGDLEVSGKETDILLRIIKLDIAKIRYYLKKILTAKEVFEGGISTVELRVLKSSATPHTDASALQQFLQWFAQIFAIRELPPDPEPEALIHHIRWAQEAKRNFLEPLKAAFSTQAQQLPRWIYAIFKLGRYGIASRAFVQLASEFPALFNPMIVEPVSPPPNMQFTLPGDAMPLTSVLRRVAGGREEECLSRLAKVWNTADPEAHFSGACPEALVVHAEIQLVSYYDHHLECKPSFRFIGVSKKSCYLCHTFLTTHPDSFSVSSCHQKLYLSWIPPPAVGPHIYKRYKNMTVELSKVMEAAARRDLDSRLPTLRTRIPADSTAGVSLSGLTEPSLGGVGIRAHLGSRGDPAVGQNRTSEEPVEMEDETAGEESPFPIGVVNLAPPIDEPWPPDFSRTSTTILTEQYPESGSSTSISTMVFHFIRADDHARQDIVSMSDIFDPSTNYPSWAKLVEFLRVDDSFGLAFKEGREFLMVNNRIRVINERQFLACLQHLRNSKILNSEVLVCRFESAS
ncbi:hypothetical protein FGG08_007003 [Glutinoglossum americanum]|uniref:Uncharacterized protein n=1 Tax=Glutinoglossum americanum TaxID=1670608 RepID=A0A9P8I680_9PEZI|nr:hypothetical protein FGG08_007003 [Glutinoglossum americanum]